MILGHGDIASVLPEREDLLFFASGVSNSLEIDEAEYKRELDFLLEQPRDAHLVYFSSLAIFYGSNRYVAHKRWMETTIKQEFPKHTIVRIGNIDWGINPHTLINFLKDKILNDRRYEIENTYRYVVNKDEFLYWINLIPDFSCEMNIPGRRLKVQQIAGEIKEHKL